MALVIDLKDLFSFGSSIIIRLKFLEELVRENQRSQDVLGSYKYPLRITDNPRSSAPIRQHRRVAMKEKIFDFSITVSCVVCNLSTLAAKARRRPSDTRVDQQ